MPNRDLLIAILHEDFLAFVTRAFDEVEPRVNLAVENYIRLLAHEPTALAAGDTKRLILSAPPRHLKSLLTSVFLPAWMLGRIRGCASSSSATRWIWRPFSHG
jgi:hypothetical protein